MTSEHDPSGHALAEQAHAAGVVEPPVVVPTFTVSVSFELRGTEQHADAVMFTLLSELSARSDVVSTSGSFVEHT